MLAERRGELTIDMFPELPRIEMPGKEPLRLPEATSLQPVFSPHAAAIYQEIRGIKVDPLAAVEDHDVNFRGWVQSTDKNDQISCVALVIASGEAQTVEDAYRYINEFISSIPAQERPVVISDMDGNHHPHKRSVIKTILGEHVGGINGNVMARYYGTVGHRAVPDLLTGKLVNLKPFEDLDMSQMAKIVQKNPDLSFAPYLGTIKRLTASLRNNISANRGVVSPKDVASVVRLEGLLAPVFKPHLEALGEMPIVGIENYAFTLMTWSSVLEYAVGKSKRVLFTEKVILPYEQDVWAGKSDALEVLSINGHSPTTYELKIIEKLTGYKFESWVDIIKCLTGTFGSDITIKNIDWKMSVGDGRSPWKPITRRQIPLPEHVKKTLRYVTFGTLAYTLSTGRSGIEGGLEKTIITDGDIVYFMPGEPPIVAHNSFDLETQERYLREVIARNFKDSQTRATIRGMNLKVMSHCASLLGDFENRYSGGEIVVKEVPPNYTYELPISNASTPSIARIIEHYADEEKTLYSDTREYLDDELPPEAFGETPRVYTYTFADEEKIRITTKTREGVPFEMAHYGNLIDSVRAGRKTKNFNPKTGGYVLCINPEHPDNNPDNCYANPARRNIHCYTCGAHYIIAKETIPTELDIRFDNKDYKSIRGENGEILVPEEHHQIMVAAGELMQKAFKGSPAERYVGKDRKIDVDLALAYGAGYATNKIIFELVTSGYTFDDLKQAGLFGFSKSPTCRGGVTSFFKRHGLAEDQLVDENGKFPFFILCDRVTFPLQLEKITSYYGRALWDANEFKHAKLLTRYSMIPQTAFNMDLLVTSPYDEIILTEGVFDALTLISMGYPTIALVGTHNFLTMKELASSQVTRIGMALHNDGPGSRVAVKLLEWLRTAGYKGDSYNFTTEFLEKYPEAQRYKDPNEVWVKELYQKFRKVA